MNSRKVFFLILFTFISIIGCQKDDEQLQELEQLENISGKSFKTLNNIEISSFCNYIIVDVRIISGNYSGCELYEKMNRKKQELSQKIDSETGCPIYDIPETHYFNCDLMDSPIYVEQWKILPKYYCGGNYPCTDSEGNPMEPDNDFPLEEDDD